MKTRIFSELKLTDQWFYVQGMLDGISRTLTLKPNRVSDVMQDLLDKIHEIEDSNSDIDGSAIITPIFFGGKK